MKKKKIIILFIGALLTFGFFTGPAKAAGPSDSIKTTIDAVLDIMRDGKMSSLDKRSERREKIGALVRGRFDFPEMSKRSLARHWNKASADEKKEFVSLFSDLLEASYIGKIEAYTDEKVNYDKESVKGKGDNAVVNTIIVTKSVDIPIDYKLHLDKDQWLVYDVVIEGVSFISTYRTQYDKIIMKDSFAGLLQQMKEKLTEVNATENMKLSKVE